MPQQRMFFPLFEKHAELTERAAIILAEMLNDGVDVSGHCHSIGELEQEADIVTRNVLLGIRASFITPFDRSDIRNHPLRSR